MKVKQLAAWPDMVCHAMPNGERTVTGVYIGDLLSWVMGRAPADAAWITIMSNANVAAVATLADVACVILAENVQPDAQLLQTAQSKEINLFTSPLSAYELAVHLAQQIENE